MEWNVPGLNTTNPTNTTYRSSEPESQSDIKGLEGAKRTETDLPMSIGVPLERMMTGDDDDDDDDDDGSAQVVELDERKPDVGK